MIKVAEPWQTVFQQLFSWETMFAVIVLLQRLSTSAKPIYIYNIFTSMLHLMCFKSRVLGHYVCMHGENNYSENRPLVFSGNYAVITICIQIITKKCSFEQMKEQFYIVFLLTECIRCTISIFSVYSV